MVQIYKNTLTNFSIRHDSSKPAVSVALLVPRLAHGVAEDIRNARRRTSGSLWGQESPCVADISPRTASDV